MEKTDVKQRILVLCTGNSARSQMAEGWLRLSAGDRFDVFSAGSRPSGYVHPGAIQAMAEIGIDISRHASKSMNDFKGQAFDYVLTVCDNAAEECPVFPGKATRLHHGFTDPAKVPESEQAESFRRVRDELIAWLNEHFPPTDDLITIGAAQSEELAVVEALLTQNHLPVDGLADHFGTAVVARSGGKVVGSAALEIYNDAALLRSVAVSPALQGQGLGQRLTLAALALAHSRKISKIVLLTETASKFFPRFGFQPIERSAVPEALKQSVEFTGACPDSALAMAVRLEQSVNAIN
jgi:thioredoxin type arsenate reductase